MAPSQSASQIIPYDDHAPPRSNAPYPRHTQHDVAGSITGSIAEEDEDGSSSEEDPSQFVVHENRPGSQMSPRLPPKGRATPTPKSPTLGVPSVNSRTRPLSDAESPRLGGRRAASDIGAGAYRPPSSRALRRTISHEEPSPRRAGSSDTSSIREHRPKKKGFFASIGRLFKGKKHGSERSASPPYGSSRGGWQTRTDSNVKRANAFGGARGGDESSSDEDDGNLVSVSNNRNSTWTVDPTRSSGSHIKRSSSMPIANGLIPPKPTRSTSQSTITPTNKPKTTGTSNVSRSNTVKSGVSEAGTLKSGSTVKKKTRPNGSIARAKTPSSINGHGQGAGVAGRNIMTLVDPSKPPVPVMPEVPKAPKSQVNPQMEGVKAPGSSIVTADTPLPPIKHTPSTATSAGPPALGRSISSKSAKKKEQVKPKDSPPYRPTTPLPPSRTLSPPLKSAMRPTSPQPHSLPPPKLDLPTTPMYTISAPAPISLEEVKKEQEREKEEQDRKKEEQKREKEEQKSRDAKRGSFVSLQSDGASIYESAMEDGDEGYGPETESSDEDDAAHFKMVKNEKVIRRGEMATGDPNYMKDDEEDGGSEVTVGARSEPTAVAAGAAAAAPPTLGAPADAIPRRRKSVRMAVPDSPVIESHPPAHVSQAPRPIAVSTEVKSRSRTPSPEPQRLEQTWSTRIGRMREDTSEDEDEDDDYVRARKGLIKTNKWDTVNAAAEKAKGLKKKGSVKSKASRA